MYFFIHIHFMVTHNNTVKSFIIHQRKPDLAFISQTLSAAAAALYRLTMLAVASALSG
jgi:hypothetical protein